MSSAPVHEGEAEMEHASKKGKAKGASGKAKGKAKSGGKAKGKGKAKAKAAANQEKEPVEQKPKPAPKAKAVSFKTQMLAELSGRDGNEVLSEYQDDMNAREMVIKEKLEQEALLVSALSDAKTAMLSSSEQLSTVLLQRERVALEKLRMAKDSRLKTETVQLDNAVKVVEMELEVLEKQLEIRQKKDLEAKLRLEREEAESKFKRSLEEMILPKTEKPDVLTKASSKEIEKEFKALDKFCTEREQARQQALQEVMGRAKRTKHMALTAEPANGDDSGADVD